MTHEKKLIARLNAAYGVGGTLYNGLRAYRIIRAAVKAVIPGRQNKKNIADALNKAVTAACRVIRRSK